MCLKLHVITGFMRLKLKFFFKQYLPGLDTTCKERAKLDRGTTRRVYPTDENIKPE
jgi:hypothetical protein